MDSWENRAFEDRMVTSAFIDALTTEFIQHRRGYVDLAIVSREAITAAHAVPLNEALPMVRILIYDLAAKQPQAFRCQGTRLLLTENAMSNPSLASDALRDFRKSVENTTPRPKKTDPATDRAVDPAEREALDDFFSGFEQEILRARLGEDGSQGVD